MTTCRVMIWSLNHSDATAYFPEFLWFALSLKRYHMEDSGERMKYAASVNRSLGGQ